MGRSAKINSATLAELWCRRQAPSPGGESLLAELFALLESSGPAKINFVDLAGLSLQIPDLRLPVEYQLHSGALCEYAKSCPETRRDCIRNKHAVSRMMVRRARPVAGMCHLGITELVEPLVIGGRVYGIFYYGAVVPAQTYRQAVARVRRYCQRRQVHPKPFLAKLAKLPKVTQLQVARLRVELSMVARLTVRIVEAWGFPVGNERIGIAGRVWEEHKHGPVCLTKGMEIVNAEYGRPVALEDLARRLRVSADYLGRLFRRRLGVTFPQYLARVRISHAVRLLETGRLAVSEVGQRTGFFDQAHFTRAFKRLTGTTPKTYRNQKRA